MFSVKNHKDEALDAEIAALMLAMQNIDKGTKEYSLMVDQLIKLKTLNTKKRVSPDTWVTAGASLAGILSILAFEHSGVITSKALNFVMKAR